MGKAQRRKQIARSGNNITEETIKMAGAVEPKDEALPPAIVWGVQMENIHDYKGLFMGSLNFINRGFNPVKYLFTTEQFDRALQSLIDQKTLVFRNGGYYLHPDVLHELDKKSGRNLKPKAE
ncbi:hypothetical protein H6G41_30730 [Tolypothrix sp. FACHB-123]|uniref:hypothetical protein n=1 Tax=Tolypothrix sp. FACHB-123 TaxID=2692868 RepID=UPI0016884D64|nr:hypothetical protein [Tolypothrix sp. FACHB-123]MBD2358924.1 hypothetical protein [Tolypothrix sp. FACHB-123]